MKKVKEEYYCDDCGKLTDATNISTYQLDYFDKPFDICVFCIIDRLNHSFSICEDRICQKCGGKGYTDFYRHNEYYCKDCPNCNGKGYLELING